MKPAIDKLYHVSELSILNVIRAVAKDHHLVPHDLKKLHLLDNNFSTMIPKVLKWFCNDFHPLQEPSCNYKQQAHIDTSLVKMASTAMIHFGLDPGKCIRFLGGEYTGYSCNIQKTSLAVKDHISHEDIVRMK
jgi:hypothetical protein